MSLCHENITSMIKTNSDLIIHFKMSITELESLMPWEREIYIELIRQHVDKENQRIRERNNAGRNTII
jgi:hemerythrin-like domain-containing protein|tara:strand:- start:2048 stop:2251 length:204 start_codon:yes stop_codon:yes gene_type:complete